MFCGTYRTLARFFVLMAGLSLLSAGASAAEGWVPIGPIDVGIVTGLSAGASAVYAGTSNGVYRSVDGGSTWSEAGLQGERVFNLAADPRSETIYAILQSRDWIPFFPQPSSLIEPASFDDALWVSNDGGQSWSRKPFLGVMAVAVDLSQPDTAYIATFFSPLWMTHDSGATWERLPQYPAGPATRLWVDARDGAVYANDPPRVGVNGTWNPIPLDFHSASFGAGSGPDGAVYAAGGYPFRFCRRTNATPEWTCNPFPGSAPGSILELPGSAAHGPRILVAASDGVWSSDDVGLTWSRQAGAPFLFTAAIALDPSGTVVYAGNELGVYRSADRGDTWTKASRGLRSTWVRALALDPTNPSTIWLGAEGRGIDFDSGPGLFRSTDAGRSWTALSGAGELASVTALAIDPSNPRSLYAGSLGSSFHTEDGGTSWSRSTLGPTVSYVCGLAVDPDSSRAWIAAIGGGLKSSSGTSAWSNSALTRNIFSLLFDPRRPGTIYAASDWEASDYSGYPIGDGGSVITSRDSGATWTRSETDLGAAVFAVATDPFSDSVVYAGTTAGTIFRSPDAGRTWQRWDTRYPGYGVLALLADPVRPGNLYAGNWSGLLRSVDGGSNWHPFSEGLSPYAVYGLAVSPDGRWLYAGTDGGGVFRRDLTSPADREPLTTLDRPRIPQNVRRRSP